MDHECPALVSLCLIRGMQVYVYTGILEKRTEATIWFRVYGIFGLCRGNGKENGNDHGVWKRQGCFEQHLGLKALSRRHRVRWSFG